MALGRKTANLLFLQEISLYDVTFSEDQNFLKKKSESTAVVWKRECNSLVARKMENLLRVWNGSAAICRNSRTPGTNVVSLLHLLQQQPHYNTHMVSLLQLLQGKTNCRYLHYFLITVYTERAIPQAHLWFLYCRGGCEGSLIDTHLIDQRIMGENPNAFL